MKAIAFHEKHGCPSSFARGSLDQTIQCLAKRRGCVQGTNGVRQSRGIGQLCLNAFGLFSRRVNVLLTLSARILESPTRFFECPLSCLLPRFSLPTLRVGLELSRFGVVLARLGLSLSGFDVAVALVGIACCRVTPFRQLALRNLRRLGACDFRLGRQTIALISRGPRQLFPASHQGGVDVPLERVENSIEGVVYVIVERRHLRNYTAEPKGLMGLDLRPSWPSEI